MAYDNRPNLSSARFDQHSGDTLNLCGTNCIVGLGTISSDSGYGISGITMLRTGAHVHTILLGCNTQGGSAGLAIGTAAHSMGIGSISIGCGSCACGNCSVAIGNASKSFCNHGTIIGANSINCAVGSTIIGGCNNLICSASTNTVLINGIDYTLENSDFSNYVVIPNLAIYETPAGTGSFLCWNSSTKKVGLSESGVGTLTGATNLGTGNGQIYSGLTNHTLYFKTLSGGTNITLTANDNYIGINANIGDITNLVNVTKPIYLPNHGFSVMDVIGWSGGTYNKAIADNTYSGETIGIVSKVVDVDNFYLTQSGYVTGLTGLVTNSTYFLSDSIAGQISINAPTVDGHVVKSVLIADSVTSAWIFPYVGYVLDSGTTQSNTFIGLDDTPNSYTGNDGKWLKVSGTSLVFTAAPSGENSVTGATNLGTGNGQIYTSLSNKNLQFKTLSGGTNITLTCNGNYIGINASGGSPAGSDGQLQYNNANSFGGMPIYYDDSLNRIHLCCDIGGSSFFNIKSRIDDDDYGFETVLSEYGVLIGSGSTTPTYKNLANLRYAVYGDDGNYNSYRLAFDGNDTGSAESLLFIGFCDFIIGGNIYGSAGPSSVPTLCVCTDVYSLYGLLGDCNNTCVILSPTTLCLQSSNIGFFNTSPITKPTVTGSKGGNAALASLITALSNLGLITDSTT